MAGAFIPVSGVNTGWLASFARPGPIRYGCSCRVTFGFSFEQDAVGFLEAAPICIGDGKQQSSEEIARFAWFCQSCLEKFESFKLFSNVENGYGCHIWVLWATPVRTM